MSDAAFHTALSFLFTTFLFVLAIPFAQRIELVDKPDFRKAHGGDVPLIGGLTIYFAVLLGLLLFFDTSRQLTSYLVAAGLLVLAGAVDDKRNLDFRIRIVIEVIAASVMIIGAGLKIGNLGNLLGFGEIHMAYWASYLFTLVAVFGIVNAMNMIDGLDGLAAAVILLSLLLLQGFTTISQELDIVGPLITGAIFAFLVFNLRLLPRTERVFLGDAGSKLLGFTLVWFLIDVAKSGSNDRGGIDPATALFFVAIPLYDMVAITLRRVLKGFSPFQPDRTHIHHLFMAAGLSPRKTLGTILLLDLAIKLTGIVLNKLDINENVQFGVFFVLFIVYFCSIQMMEKTHLSQEC